MNLIVLRILVYHIPYMRLSWMSCILGCSYIWFPFVLVIGRGRNCELSYVDREFHFEICSARICFSFSSLSFSLVYQMLYPFEKDLVRIRQYVGHGFLWVCFPFHVGNDGFLVHVRNCDLGISLDSRTVTSKAQFCFSLNDQRRIHVTQGWPGARYNHTIVINLMGISIVI